MRTLVPNYIGYGYSPACCKKRMLVGDRFGNADVGPPPDTGDGGGPDPKVDPYFDNVVLLVGSEDGTNLDESTYHYGTGGGAVSTTNAKFGHNSIDPSVGVPMYDGGIGDHNFDLSADQMTEFTIEAWIYANVLSGGPMVFIGKSFFSISWALMVQPWGDLRFAYQSLESGFGGHGSFTNIMCITQDASGNVIPPVPSIHVQEWTYVALTKDAAKNYRLYIGDNSAGRAVMVGKTTPNDASIDNSGILESISLGNIGLFGTNQWIGQIDEIRVTKNVARYTTDTNFPLPTGPWPRPSVMREATDAESLRSDA